METNDLRYLLDCEILPEYNIQILIPVWESILKEYEKLTNSFAYTNQLKKTNHNASKLNRLSGLVACYYLIKYNHPDAKKYADYWHVSDNIEKLTTTILQEKTRLNIDYVRNKQPKAQKQDADLEKIIVQLENSLERNLDIEKISVKKWVYLCKSIEDRARALENLKHNGRKNSSR